MKKTNKQVKTGLVDVLVSSIQMADKCGRGVTLADLQQGYLTATKQRKNPRKNTQPKLSIVVVGKTKTTITTPIATTYENGGVQTISGDVFFVKKVSGGFLCNVEKAGSNYIEV